jgi:TPR repeat protein
LRGGEFVLFDRSDYRAALNELLPQARAGNPVAQSYVGEIYEKGLGLPAPDPAEASSWYRKAAQQGDIAAQVALGSLYERGMGLPVDKAEALNWYRRASGIVDDPLQFSSAFAAERRQLRQEIAKRQQIIAQLKTRPSPSSKRQLAAQKRDATSRAQRLTQQANAARRHKQAVAQQAKAAPQAAQAALQAKVQRLEKLELAYRDDSDLMFQAAQVAAVQ